RSTTMASSSVRAIRRIACRINRSESPGVESHSMSQLFQRKPIAALVQDTEGSEGLKRTLGAGDLIMLAIGAVIGAGIFGAIGTAAAGQIGPNGEVIRL